MEVWGVWLTAIGVFVAGAAAVFAWVQAHAAVESRRDAVEAQRKAELAQAEATRIAGEARDALSRSAAALERANEIEESKIPKPRVHWTISPHNGSVFLVQNTGQLVARNVKLSGTSGIMTDEDSEADEVAPGHTLEFAAWRGMGMETPRLTIEWDDPVAEERLSETITIRV